MKIIYVVTQSFLQYVNASTYAIGIAEIYITSVCAFYNKSHFSSAMLFLFINCFIIFVGFILE